MQITITFEADTLDEACDKLRAAVRLTDADLLDQAWDAPNPPPSEFAPLENLDDLKPAPTHDEVYNAVKALLGAKDKEIAFEVLARFDGAKNVGDICKLPAARQHEFIATAAKEAAK